MKKEQLDIKTLLLKNMAMLNSDFKAKPELLNEAEEKWIQNAVNPKHKGYCTPMTKPTCTPKRKALAKRFKKGVENESVDLTDVNYPEMINKMKTVLDSLLNNEDYESIDALRYFFDKEYRKSVKNKPVDAIKTQKIVPEKTSSWPTGKGEIRSLGYNEMPSYAEKTEFLKEILDKFDNNTIGKLNEIFSKLFN